MSKTELIYFNSFQESKYGTYRGLIAFIQLFLTLSVFYSINRKRLKLDHIWIRTIIVSLILCSALAVQIPKTYLESVLYGLLVGFSISAITVNFMKQTYIFSILFIVFMTIMCSIISISTFFLSKKLNLYNN